MSKVNGSAQTNAIFDELNGITQVDETNVSEHLEALESELVELDVKAKGSSGIPPVTPSKLYSRMAYTRGRGRAGVGWRLPGNGVKRSSCGTFKKLDGCLNYPEHQGGKAAVAVVQWHCNSLACPVCAGHAMSRAADRIVHRVVSWWEKHNLRWAGHHVKPIHVVVSPPEAEWKRLASNYPRLRDLATQVALDAGLIGGAVIPHPYRHEGLGDELPEGFERADVRLDRGWYESWHFHMIGFGWIDPELVRDGWLVKNLGVRGESPKDHQVFELARYQLSHCGVNDKYHSVTWIGQLSAHKFKAPPMAGAEPSKCPECGRFLYPVVCDVAVNLPPKEGLYWVDPPGWRYVGGAHA